MRASVTHFGASEAIASATSALSQRLLARQVECVDEPSVVVARRAGVEDDAPGCRGDDVAAELQIFIGAARPGVAGLRA